MSLAIFLVGFRYIGSGDTEPAEFLPIAILEHHTVTYDWLLPAPDLPYSYRQIAGHVLSAYPILPGLLNVPVFRVARSLEIDLSGHRQALSLFSAAGIAALSVLFVFLGLSRICRTPFGAIGFAMVYAIGTGVWSIASRGLWQHGPVLLFTAISVWLLLEEAGWRTALAGLFVGLAVVTRPAIAALLAPLGVYVLRERPRQFWGFASLAVGVGSILAVWGKLHFGSATALIQDFPSGGFKGSPLEGLAGVLISPSRGLFALSPVLLFAGVGIAKTFGVSGQTRSLLRYLAVGAALYALLVSRWSMWWGGHCFGSRLVLEAALPLVFLLGPAWEAIGSRPLWRVAFVFLLAASVYANALGALVYPSTFNDNLDLETARLWSVKSSELVLCTRKLLGFPAPMPPRVPTMWWEPRINNDDIPGWIDDSPGRHTIHGALTISGWAKSATGDVEVRAVLDDGRMAIPERFPRPDLSRVLPQLGDASRAGFRAVFAPPAVSGRHAVAVEFRDPGGRVRRLGPIRFDWRP